MSLSTIFEVPLGLGEGGGLSIPYLANLWPKYSIIVNFNLKNYLFNDLPSLYP